MTFDYFLAVGSNINPKQNAARVLDALLTLSPTLWLSRLVWTVPVGFETPLPFVNFTVRMASAYTPERLKATFNQIEIDLGRDRTHPASKKRDRPADIDIIHQLPAGQSPFPITALPPEPYILPIFLELLSTLNLSDQHAPLPMGIAPIFFHGQELGRFPARIERNMAGDVQIFVLRLFHHS